VASRRRIAWSFEARRTLQEILEFIHRDSPEGAIQVLDQALAAAASLATLAERGRAVPELADPSVREIFVYRYRLMYRVSEESVQVLAFIHGARDFERWRAGE
jgi:plasmid stabilization system protein ParE